MLNKFRQKYLYSKDTHKILNLWTLDIKDKEIAQQYEDFRVNRFNQLYWALIAVCIFFNFFGFVRYFFLGGEFESALRPLH